MKDILDFSKECKGESLTSEDEDLTNSLDYYTLHERKEMDNIILNTQKLAIQAMEKELKMENMIEHQEELKGKQIEEEMNQKLLKVKEQQELITKALEEKKKEAEIYNTKLSLKTRLKQMTQQFKDQIQKVRDDLKLRLQEKKSQDMRNIEAYENKINEAKKIITKDLLQANHRGNYEECDPDHPDSKRIAYCNEHYKSDERKREDCKKQDKFCTLCCQSEYGDLHLEDRTDCYSKCDAYYIYHLPFSHKSNSSLNINNLFEDVKKTELLKLIKDDLSNI
jgi:hypothetical protein